MMVTVGERGDEQKGVSENAEDNESGKHLGDL